MDRIWLHPEGELNEVGTSHQLVAPAAPSLDAVPLHEAPSPSARPEAKESGEARVTDPPANLGGGGRRWRLGSRGRAVAATIGVLSVAWAAFALLRAPDGGDRPIGAATQRPESTFGQEVGGATSVEQSFDGLPMDSRLPDPWAVGGGGAASIVALPTSVDRSARLVSSSSGAPAAACLPLGSLRAPEVTIGLDYRLGRAAGSPVTLVGLQSGGATKVRLLIDVAGVPTGVIPADGVAASASTVAPTTAPAGGSAPTSDWHHVDLTFAIVSGDLTWRAMDRAGRETGSGWGHVPDLAAQPIDAVCLYSPEGAPSGWVAIDDLIVRG